MALINFARREIEVKIVFYGPAYSGKTTNVEVLHRLMPATQRGELHSLRTEQDRTLFFDYVPVQLGEIAGFRARFKLFTVPGQVFYKDTRRVVLQGADAVVFVADSSPGRAPANLESLVDLEENLAAHGLDLHSIPLVLQLNKRDLPDAVAVEAMLAELNPFGVPFVEAAAAEGRGVLDTLRRVTDIAAQRIRENLSGQDTAVELHAVERATPEDDRNVVREQMDAIRKVRPGEDARVRRLQESGQLDAGQVDAVLSELVVRSEDVTPPEPIAPLDGPFDELPVPRDPVRPAQGRAASAAAPEVTPAKDGAPLGAPLDAWLDAPGARIREVRGAREIDGHVQIEVIADWADGRRRHPVTLHLGVPTPPVGSAPVGTMPVGSAPVGSAPVVTPPVAPPPPQGALRWVAFGGATFVTAISAMLLGVALGWVAFAHG